MKRRSALGVAILLILSVTAIFISPAIDLQPTALRALQLANMLLALLVLLGTSVLALLFTARRSVQTDSGCDCFSPPPTSDLVDLNCTRRC